MFSRPLEEQNITQHSADICFDTDVESETPNKIGKIEFTLINRSRMMNGLDGDSSDNLFESCDAISHELMMMYSVLFDEEGEPTNPELEGLLEGDIMYLDSIVIEPRFRGMHLNRSPHVGYGIGLLAVDGLRGIFPSFEMDLVLLNPAASIAELEKYPGTSPEVAQKKLIAYWSLLGMNVWAPSSSDFKLMGMWTGLRLPNIEEVWTGFSMFNVQF
ncbi:hypothetical protein B0H15DRAFT_994613 [Mycena belliarum]|uniref:Uncharacterized protein n=1 Tax=Mycena belliarum TaxID=1033014 RepID=A0AAD6U1T5_9AGAR|nr:hypothetical protein B0H15DRAFT_994613 [Mycena belliae]